MARALGDDNRLLSALWSATDLYRVLVLGYVAYLYASRLPQVARPLLGWSVLALLAVWTLLVLVLRRRSTPVLAVELALAGGAILVSRLVDTPEVIATGAPTVPGMWPAATVVAWAIARGPVGGTFAAGVVAVADLLVIEVPSAVTIHNIVILLLLGGCIGYCAELARSGHAALREALATQARTAERERLARTVHDGVLQTLAYLHRRGLDAGGELAELGRLAGEQERVLRALIAEPPAGAGASAPASAGAGDTRPVDVGALLRRHGGGTVTVSTPATAVLLAPGRARELDAAVGAALDNVARHAGPGAHAWILLEEDAEEVVVSIRDDGPGIPAGRLAQARDEGRLGIHASIVGRLSDLGGRAVVAEGLGVGTRLELRLPVAAPGPSRRG